MSNPLLELQAQLTQLKTMIQSTQNKANSIANTLDSMCGSMESSPKRVNRKKVAETMAKIQMKHKLREAQ
jgi:Cu/Ag efflux protein CusF